MQKQGTTAECLTDYLSRIRWNNKKTSIDLQPLTNFINVGPAAARLWYNRATEPLGSVLVRVRYFLENQGYQVTELEKLSPSVYQLGKLIAYNVINLDDVYQEIGFNRSQDLLRLLHGMRPPSGERLLKIKEICEVHKEKLSAIDKPGEKHRNEPAKLAYVKTNQNGSGELKEVLALLKSLDGLVELLEPRLEHMLSDVYTPEERQAFRDRATPELIFNLANRFYGANQKLNALCSEMARKKITGQK